MKVNKEALLGIIAKYESTPITVIGDLMLDHYIWGKVERISPEAPVVVVNVNNQDWRLGGAGNVLRNLTSLGAKVLFCGMLGEDDAGKKTIELFNNEQADIKGLQISKTRKSTIKTRVIAHSQHVVRIDQEEISPPTDLEIENTVKAVTNTFSQTKGVIVSDYGKGFICANLLNSLAGNFKNFLEKNIPIVVDPKSPNYNLYKNVTVIKPNLKEASESSGIKIKDKATAREAGRILLEKWGCKQVLITLGELGMVGVSSLDKNAETINIDTVAKNVFDVSGAGDTVSAAYTLSLAVGASGEQAAQIANFAAGIVVSEVGTIAIEKDKLIKAIQESKD